MTATNGFKAGSNLEKILSEGKFAVTGECGPPKSTDVTVIENKAKLLKGYVDAVNITDNQTAVVRVCSMASVGRKWLHTDSDYKRKAARRFVKDAWQAWD
jgi:5,10-methylenetetrahydrofolate reductase